MKLLDPKTLAGGTDRQKAAFAAIESLKLFDLLAEHSPVLTGTFPLDLDIPSSDIDVICSSANLESFAQLLVRELGHLKSFSVEHQMVRNSPTVLARFTHGGFSFEIFTQSSSVFTQPAVIHLLVEARLLMFAPKEAKEKIRSFKLQGLKTEPAFAACFELEGDPYEELLKIAKLPDHEILNITHRFRFAPTTH